MDQIAGWQRIGMLRERRKTIRRLWIFLSVVISGLWLWQLFAAANASSVLDEWGETPAPPGALVLISGIVALVVLALIFSSWGRRMDKQEKDQRDQLPGSVYRMYGY